MHDEVVLGAAAMALSAKMGSYTCAGEFFGGFEVEGMCASLGEFDRAFFSDILFEKCDFSGSSFHKANLDGVRFVDCDLSGIDFDGAELNSVSFLDCYLSKTTFQSSTIENLSVTNCFGGVDFSDVEMSLAAFFTSDLTGSSFYNASLDEVTFSSCNLSQVFLSKGTVFENVKILKCDITELGTAVLKGGYVVVDCKYRPYTTIPPTIKPVLRLVGQGETSGRRLPQNKAYSCGLHAFIYCSNTEEYENVT